MAEYRQVLPPSVQRWIGTGVPVVRVSIDIVRKQYGKHADVRSWFEEFDLDSWEFARVVIGDRGRKWEFVQLVEDAPG
jgi:hypothetical protein